MSGVITKNADNIDNLRKKVSNYLLRSGMRIDTIKLITGASEEDILELIPKIKKVRLKKGRGYIVSVVFEDETERAYNVKPLIEELEKWHKLIDRAEFKKYKILKDGKGIVWDKDLIISSRAFFEGGKLIFDKYIEDYKDKRKISLKKSNKNRVDSKTKGSE